MHEHQIVSAISLVSPGSFWPRFGTNLALRLPGQMTQRRVTSEVGRLPACVIGCTFNNGRLQLRQRAFA